MKKIIIALGVIAVLYVAAAFAAWRFLPQKIANVQERLFDVRVAIGKLAQDQWVVSERVKAITKVTLGNGLSKIDEVSELLSDPDLNHLAREYLGTDWTLQHSAFLGQVAHARKLLSSQKEQRGALKSRMNEKVKALEARKRVLMRDIKSPSTERAWQIEMHDIEEQLDLLRNSNAYREYFAKDNYDEKHIEATAKNEDTIFQMASQYQNNTVGMLIRVMAEKLSRLKWEENEPERLRRLSSYFNIWPLNLVFKMPLEENADEKRL